VPVGTILMLVNARRTGTAALRRPGDLRHGPPERPPPPGVRRGIHTCPGAPLARTEARAGIERLLERTTGIALSERVHGPAGARRFDYLPTFILRGLTHLNLEFSTGPAPAPAAPRVTHRPRYPVTVAAPCMPPATRRRWTARPLRQLDRVGGRMNPPTTAAAVAATQPATNWRCVGYRWPASAALNGRSYRTGSRRSAGLPSPTGCDGRDGRGTDAAATLTLPSRTKRARARRTDLQRGGCAAGRPRHPAVEGGLRGVQHVVHLAGVDGHRAVSRTLPAGG